MKVLNVYQINLIQTLKFMHKTKYGINPRIFLTKVREIDYQYPTRFPKTASIVKDLLILESSPALRKCTYFKKVHLP